MKASHLLAFLALSATAPAALLVYEPFDYPSGTSIGGQNGGTGFAGPWGAVGAGNLDATAPGATYSNLVASGNRLTTIGGSGGAGSALSFRDLSTSFGADNTTVWISLIGQRTGAQTGTGGIGGVPSWVRGWNVSLFNAGTEILAIGEGTRTTGDQDTWGLVVSGSSTNAATVWTSKSVGVESFLLVRIDYLPGNDNAYLWVNPSLASEPLISNADATTTAGNFSFNRIRPFAGNETAQGARAEGFFDEIRMGTTFRDVAPIPEPSAVVALISGLGLFLRRRR